MTFAWMLVEAGIAVYAAVTARSAVLLAFGSDSVIELLSAAVVLLQWTPGFVLSERLAARIASLLLYALAGVVTVVASASWLWKVQPETSRSGILLTIAALVAMPVLATLKRREAARTGNRALAADATQSATCAYLALITLCGLSLRASLGIAWFDSLAALAAVPLLVREARSVARGEGCGCC
jgi:divalent metal cation (Fe/Co/Zn/Cd) transporter